MKRAYLVAVLLFIAGALALFFWAAPEESTPFLGAISQFYEGSDSEDLVENEDGQAEWPSVEEMAGRMIIVGFRGTEASNIQVTLQMLSDVKPGALILFDRDLPSGNTFPRNIVSYDQLARLISEIKAHVSYDVLIAVDAEGGIVNRLNPSYGFLNMPSHQALGALAQEQTYEKSKLLATQLKHLNIDINFAPVVDIHNTSSPVIGAIGRSFSTSPTIIARHAQQFVRAHYEEGITPVLKHFPGHGSAMGDTHRGIVDVTNFWTEMELIPYEELIADGYAGPIMTAHVINKNLSALPATLSHEIITEMLREQLGFRGVIISDDLQMQAIASQYGIGQASVMAIRAGADMVIVSNNIGEYDSNVSYEVRDAIVRAVENGEITRERLHESYLRILEINGQND